MKIFEPSSLAAAFEAPKITKPLALKISTMPSTRAVSGPTTVSSILFFLAKSANSS